MKFSKELQRGLEEHCMWLDIITDNHVKLWKDDDLHLQHSPSSMVNGT